MNFELYFHLRAQNQQVLLPANFVAVCKQGLITVNLFQRAPDEEARSILFEGIGKLYQQLLQCFFYHEMQQYVALNQISNGYYIHKYHNAFFIMK